MRSVFQSFGFQQHQGVFHLFGCNPMFTAYTFQHQEALKNIRTEIPTIGFKPFLPQQNIKLAQNLKKEEEEYEFESSKSSEIDQLSSEPKIKSRFKKPRKGPYKKYTKEEKFYAMEKINKGQDINKVMEELKIPRRSLLRWKKNGCERKEGGGRPSDFQMQIILFEMIINKQISQQEEIREYALKYSTLKNFKASKGWYVKFGRRFNEYKSKQNLKQSMDIEHVHQIN